jgi:hypothetical protein
VSSTENDNHSTRTNSRDQGNVDYGVLYLVHELSILSHTSMSHIHPFHREKMNLILPVHHLHLTKKFPSAFPENNRKRIYLNEISWYFGNTERRKTKIDLQLFLLNPIFVFFTFLHIYRCQLSNLCLRNTHRDTLTVRGLKYFTVNRNIIKDIYRYCAKGNWIWILDPICWRESSFLRVYRRAIAPKSRAPAKVNSPQSFWVQL